MQVEYNCWSAKEIDDLREKEDQYDLDRLQEIDDYIQELEDYHKSKLNG